VAIAIFSDSVVLDCKNYTIEDVNNAAASVIVLIAGNNVTVKNGIFKSAATGLMAESLLTLECIENEFYRGTTPGFSYGFGPAIDPRNGSDNGTVFPQYNTIWRNCIVEGNSATVPANGLGFDLYGQINATLINCIVQGNSGYGIYNNGSRDHGPARDFDCKTPVEVIILTNNSGGYVVQNNTINENGAGAISDTSGAMALYVGNVTFP